MLTEYSSNFDPHSYVIIGGALGGAGWYLYRLGTRPDGQSLSITLSRFDFWNAVIWTRKNPEPWQTVRPLQRR